MLKVLVPVDGSAASDRAIRHVLAFSKSHDALKVHLLNVQERADAPKVKRFMKSSRW